MQRERFARKVFKLKKAATTPQGFVRQMERCGPQGDWKLLVLYKVTR